MKVHLVLAFSLVLSSLAFPGDGADATRRAPFPSPRRSGAGRIAFNSSNVQLLGWKTLADFPGNNTSGNDCWGYTSFSGREYAIIGLSDGTGFVEVTDPGNPVIVDFEPHNSAPSLWRCIKVYQDFAYAGSEAGGGIQIFNMTNIDSGVVTASSITGGSCTTATHTLALDEVSGFLYRAGGGGSCDPDGGGPLPPSYQGLQIYSLANPAVPVLVGQWNTKYVHECQVVTWDLPGIYFGRQIAFCYSEDTSQGTNPRLQILDVTNKGAISVISTTSYTGGQFSHQGWLSDSKQHLYLNDELDDGSFGGARTRVISISNLAAPSYLGFFTSGALSIDHNLYVKGNRIYEGNYRSGLRVFDNTVSQTAPTQIGFFDTYPEDDGQDFNSLWSNYPYFDSGTIIGGDIEKGLWVWRFGDATLTFDFPGGAPEFVGTLGGPIQFEVHENTAGDLMPGTVQFHYSTGGPFTDMNATSLGGDLYQAVLPALSCGTGVQFYVSAMSSDNVTWTDPPAGPTQVHTAIAAYGEIAGFADAFETNTGWLVNQAADLVGFTTATTGTWTRVNPIGTTVQPEDDHTDAPGTLCFVTANGSVGGSIGEADVDGGATSVRSPVIDASGLADPHLFYWRWFSNDGAGQGGNPGTMTMTVHISNNGGSSWTLLETVGPTGPDTHGGWIEHSVRIADFVTPTNNMRIRFRTADTIGAIVEAAVDDLRIIDYDCTPPDVTIATVSPATGPFDGGNFVTITGTGFQPGLTTVLFGANPGYGVNVLSSTTLQVRVPRVTGPIKGKVRRADMRVGVTVQNPGSDTLGDAYTYTLVD